MVRTKELGSAAGVINVVQTLYTTPAGRTAIVKEISTAARTGAANVSVDVLRGATAVVVWSGVLTAGAWLGSGPRFLVLEPGDVLRAIRSSGTGVLDLWVSGSELDGVAT